MNKEVLMLKWEEKINERDQFLEEIKEITEKINDELKNEKNFLELMNNSISAYLVRKRQLRNKIIQLKNELEEIAIDLKKLLSNDEISDIEILLAKISI